MSSVVDSSSILRVWVINPFDDIPNEGPRLRFWALAEELAALGHEVTWWTSDWSHRRKSRRIEDQSMDLNFSIRLVRTPVYRKNVSISRMWSHRKWGNQLLQDATTDVSDGAIRPPDIIIASLPPMEGPDVALRLRSRYGCKVVCDIMDAWPDTLLQAAPSHLRWFARGLLFPYFRILKKACRHADAISAQSHAFGEFAKVYGARVEPYVCYLGARPCEVADSLPSGDSEIFRFLYVGSMGRSYDLETLVCATRKQIESGQRCELHLAGEGERRPALERLAGADLGESIHFHGYLDQLELDALLNRCQVGIIPMLPSSKVAVPYKTGTYLSAALPVINSLPGELSELLKEAPCGQSYAACDQSSLTHAMSHYLKIDREAYDKESRAAADLFSQRFDQSKTYPAFAEWIIEQATGMKRA